MRGTDRSNRHTDRVDAKYSAGAPPIPTGLRGEGLRLWRQHIADTPPECVALIDFAALEEACLLYDRLHAYSLILADDPLEFKVSAEHCKLTTKWINYVDRFGWSPVSRARLKAPGDAPKAEDPMAVLLKLKAAQ